MSEREKNGSFSVSEIFWSAQGEGLNTGRSAIFVRLSGCSIRCRYCDQKAAWEAGERLELAVLMERVAALKERYPSSIAVITGGEPLEQDITPLVTALKEMGFFTAIETAGSLFSDLPLDWWAVAPKPNLDFAIHPALIGRIHEVKLVVSAGLDIETVETVRRQVPSAPIFLQPQFFDPQKYERAFQLFQQCQQRSIPDVRLGQQLHTVYKIR